MKKGKLNESRFVDGNKWLALFVKPNSARPGTKDDATATNTKVGLKKKASTSKGSASS